MTFRVSNGLKSALAALPLLALAWPALADTVTLRFVQTNDLNTTTRMYEGLDFGMVCVNDWLPATPEAPFGGVKQSGIGHEAGAEGVDEYLDAKAVFIGGIS